MREPMWWEDFAPGQAFTTGGATLTEAQIIEFAMRHDPQPFHIDAEAAKETFYGGLIASGFQTLLTTFRLFHAENIINTCSLGSPGIENLRWLIPVRPGDTLRVRGEVLETRPSRSRPDRGFATIAYATTNQKGETVMTYRCPHIFARRPA